jgi:hypothetical protein
MALATSLSDVAAESIIASITNNRMVFSNMPEVSATFLGLLRISQASYLAFKADAREGASAANDAPTPNPSVRS